MLAGQQTRRSLRQIVEHAKHVCPARRRSIPSISTSRSLSSNACRGFDPSLTHHRHLTPQGHATSRLFHASARLQATTDPDAGDVAPPTGETVELAYEVHQPPSDASPNAGSAEAIVVCHGLFGSKQNWRSLAKAMAKQLGVPVYAVDLRNHGTSPHTEKGMSYSDMAADLRRFVDEHKLKHIALVGHSMGGKAVQSFALSPELKPDTLDYLISVDMSPAKGPLSKEFEQYVEAMIDIDSKHCKSRQEADEILKLTEPDMGVRQFLLTNLQRPQGSEAWSFRIPVTTIKKFMAQIGDFPYNPSDRTWDGRTLFMKGSASKYLNRKNIPICDAFFPNAQHFSIDCGHWVQAEKPKEFMEAFIKFLRE